MSIIYQVENQIVENAIQKLKEDKSIAQDAYFVSDSFNRLRMDVIFNDPDFQHYLGNRIPKDKLTEHKVEIEGFIKRYKKSGRINQDAYFDYNSIDKLRSEILYRDAFLLNCFGEDVEDEIVDSIISYLKEKGIIDHNFTYDKQKFIKLRSEIKNKFNVPGTSVTPVMERLLYMLSSVKQPESIIGIGIYCGNTLIWTAGSSCGEGKNYKSNKIIGIDINKDSIDMAKDNFNQLKDIEHIELIAEDGCIFAENTKDLFDYIYLDAEASDIGKGLYLVLLKKLYQKLKPGGWVIAHDTTYPAFQKQLEGYLEFVRDKNNFSESISFDIDLYGLELSIK